MNKKLLLMVAGGLCFAALPGLASAHMPDNPIEDDEYHGKLVEIDRVFINGETIELPKVIYKDGTVCSSYVETFQRIAYGVSEYTLGEQCSKPTPSLERT